MANQIGSMGGKTWGMYITDKIMHALEMKSGNEKLCSGNLTKESQWIQLAKSVFLTDRELCHYQYFLNHIDDEDAYIETSAARGIMHFHIPLYWNDGKELKRILNSYNIFAYIEVVHGCEFVQGDLIQIDQSNFTVYNTVINMAVINKYEPINGTLFLHIIPKLYVEKLLSNIYTDYIKTFDEYKITEYATFTGNVADGVMQTSVLNLQNRNTDLVTQPFFEMCRFVSFHVELFPYSSKNNIISSAVSVSGDCNFNGYYFIGEGKVVLKRMRHYDSSEGNCIIFAVDDFLQLSKTKYLMKSFTVNCENKRYTLSFKSSTEASVFLNICDECHKIKAEYDHYPMFKSKDAYYDLVDWKVKKLVSNTSSLQEITRSKTITPKKFR